MSPEQNTRVFRMCWCSKKRSEEKRSKVVRLIDKNSHLVKRIRRNEDCHEGDAVQLANRVVSSRQNLRHASVGIRLDAFQPWNLSRRDGTF